MSVVVTIEPCKKEHVEIIVDGINDYNTTKVLALAEIWTPLEYVAKDENGT